MKILIYTFLCLFLSSCGADKLNPKAVSNQVGISGNGQECGCLSTNTPVCAAGKDYMNACIANCNGLKNLTAGHCDCSTNNTLVCGSDGKDYSECDARNANIQIIKYVPCAAQEM